MSEKWNDVTPLQVLLSLSSKSEYISPPPTSPTIFSYPDLSKCDLLCPHLLPSPHPSTLSQKDLKATNQILSFPAWNPLASPKLRWKSQSFTWSSPPAHAGPACFLIPPPLPPLILTPGSLHFLFSPPRTCFYSAHGQLLLMIQRSLPRPPHLKKPLLITLNPVLLHS